MVLTLPPLILYFCTLNDTGFWIDEIYTLDAVGRSFVDMLANRLKAGHGPLYFSFLWGWARIFGESEISLRLPALLGGLATAGVAAGLLLRHCGRRLSLTVAALVLLNTSLFQLSRTARMYTPVALVVLLTAWWVLTREDRPDRTATLVLAGLTAIAFHLHYSSALYIGGLAGYLFFRPRPAWRLLAGLGLGGATVLPWVMVFLVYRSPIDPVAWLPAARVQTVLCYPSTLAYPYWGNAVVWPLALAVGLLIAGLAWRGIHELGDGGRLLAWFWLLPWPVMIGLMMLGVGDILSVHRYFLVSAIAQLALVTAGILSWRHLWPAFATAASAAWIAAHVFGLGHSLTIYPAPDWRAAAHHLSSAGGESAPILLLARFHEPFRHYYTAGTILTYDELEKSIAETPRHGLAERIPWPADKPLWIIISRRVYKRRPRELSRRLSPDQIVGELLTTAPLLDAVEVGGLRILHVGPRQSAQPDGPPE
ncbi:MAG: glycosyltransferase family 39 protein [Acidobacteria bacterium]|nr:glycosyltransferase family 39 protein [Acidobacteriota bacterium]